MENKSNTTKYFILNELSRREMHGYEMIARIEKITGKRPSAGQIYPALRQMQSLGYLAVKTRTTGRKKVKYYKLTVSGRQFYGAMNKRFEAMIRAALGEKIKVCAHCRCEMIKGAYTKAIGGKKLHFCCVSCASSY